jgi:hypothetical protein
MSATLETLPLELLDQIWASITDPRDMNAFVQTCSSLHTLYGEKLYKRTLFHNKLFNAVNWGAENGSLATLKKLVDAGLDPHRDFVIIRCATPQGMDMLILLNTSCMSTRSTQ